MGGVGKLGQEIGEIGFRQRVMFILEELEGELEGLFLQRLRRRGDGRRWLGKALAAQQQRRQQKAGRALDFSDSPVCIARLHGWIIRPTAP